MIVIFSIALIIIYPRIMMNSRCSLRVIQILLLPSFMFIALVLADTHNQNNPESSQDNQTKEGITNTLKSPESAQQDFNMQEDLFPPPKKKRVQDAQKSYEYYMRLLEHEGTYFILLQSFPPHNVYGNNINTEIKFQLSLKLPLWRGAFWTKGSLFFAHTQTMFFQQFNFRYSSPVRDTDFKPSLFYSYPTNWKIFGGTLKELRVGAFHYSNGIGGDDCVRESFEDPIPQGCRSRSAANRIIFEGIWEAKGFGVHLSAWPYIDERRDNIDLDKYMGYANLRLYHRHKRHFTELHFSPIISDYRQYHASVRLGYAYAFNQFVSLYVQYFYGYGDNLYEYNRISHRLGIGFRATSF